VLAQFFTAEGIRETSRRIDPDVATGLDYYPLPAPGERFPINDPAFEPRMMPRPQDDAVFLRRCSRHREDRSARLPASGRLGGPQLSCVTTVAAEPRMRPGGASARRRSACRF